MTGRCVLTKVQLGVFTGLFCSGCNLSFCGEPLSDRKVYFNKSAA